MDRRSGPSPAGASLLLPVLLLLAAASAGPAAAGDDYWTASVAVTSIDLARDTLRDFGIEVASVEPSADEPAAAGSSFRSVPPSRLEFRAPGGDFERFDSGFLVHQGGFVLRLRGRAEPVDLRGFVLAVASRDPGSGAAGPDDFDWLDASGRRFFVLRSMQFTASYPDQELLLLNVSIHLSPELAALIGRPDLAGAFAGTARVRLPAVVAPEDASGGTGAGGCVETVGLPIDVKLTDLYSVSQVAREAGVRVALGLGASLQNVGEGSVAWYESIAPVQYPGGAIGPHPYLSMAMYRLDAAGRLVQLGLSDVKHAFRALNKDCPCESGPVLYPGCGDEYGISTNVDRTYLAPRQEVTAHTGDWQPVGSHFDQCLDPSHCDPATADADGIRDHFASEHDAFEHRLVVPEPALRLSGARYFVAAWYVVKGDVDVFDSMGHREVAPFFADTAWSFLPADDFVNGSILETIPGASIHTLDTGEGRLQLAVTVTPMPGGLYHYEYALLNLDFDRQVQRFELPLGVGVDAIAPDSSGLGDDPANAWTAVTSPGAVSWQAPAGRALDWGMLVSFGFETASAPRPGTATLTALEPGGPAELQIAAPEPGPGSLAAAGLATLALLGCRLRYRGGSSCRIASRSRSCARRSW